MAPGAAALYIQKWGPGTTPDAVKAALRQSAAKSFPRTSTCIDPQTGQARTIQYHLLTVGAGFLDARASLNKLPRTRSWVGLSPPASPTTVPREHEIVSSSPISRAPCSATPANCPTAPSGAPPSSGAIASCGVTASCGATTPDSSPCPPSAERAVRERPQSSNRSNQPPSLPFGAPVSAGAPNRVPTPSEKISPSPSITCRSSPPASHSPSAHTGRERGTAVSP
jgi:hypothetical protein